MIEEFQDKRCLECGFFCDLIGSLNDVGEKIILCCSCRAKQAEFCSIDTIPAFWCETCKDTVSQEIDYRITKLMKEDQ